MRLQLDIMFFTSLWKLKFHVCCFLKAQDHIFIMNKENLKIEVSNFSIWTQWQPYVFCFLLKRWLCTMEPHPCSPDRSWLAQVWRTNAQTFDKPIFRNKCMKSYSVARKFVVPKVNIRCDIRCGSLQKDVWFVCVAYPLGSGNLWEGRLSSTPCSPGPTDSKCQWTLSRSSTRPGKKTTRCVWNHMFAGILDTDGES